MSEEGGARSKPPLNQDRAFTNQIASAEIADVAKLGSPSSDWAKTSAAIAKMTGPASEWAKMSATVAKATGPASEWAKMSAAVAMATGPASEWGKMSAAVAKATGPASEWAKMSAAVAKATGPASELAKISAAVAKATGPASEWAKMSATVAMATGPGSEWAKLSASVAKVIGPGSDWAKLSAVAKLTGPSSDWAKQFAALATSNQSTTSLLAQSGEQLQTHLQVSDAIKRYGHRLDTLGNAPAPGPRIFAELTPVVGAIDRVPHSLVLEQLFAEQLVTTAANENKLNDVAGASLAVDAAVAERMIAADGPAGLSLFFDRLRASINFHFERVRSLSELFQLYNTAMLIIAVLALWYAMHSATSEDVEAVQTAVNNQTEAIREEGVSSRQQIASKFDELLRSINEQTTRKSNAFRPVKTYLVERTVPLKAERRMKSGTIAVLQMGQAVFRVRHHKNWIFVEGVDFISGEPISGWVVKKYLRRVQ